MRWGRCDQLMIRCRRGWWRYSESCNTRPKGCNFFSSSHFFFIQNVHMLRKTPRGAASIPSSPLHRNYTSGRPNTSQSKHSESDLGDSGAFISKRLQQEYISIRPAECAPARSYLFQVLRANVITSALETLIWP